MTPRARIVSTGRWLPPRVVTNHDLAADLDTSDEWIRARTGVVERRRADPDMSTSRMGALAAQIALDAGGIGPGDVDLILVSTATPDRPLPSTACDIQGLVGAVNAAAYDFSSACSGFLYGLRIAEGHIAAQHATTVLLVCVERMSSIIDPSDRATRVLFGDGAAAAVIRPADASVGLLGGFMKSDGRLADILHRPSAGSRYVRMDGPAVFKAAVTGMYEAASAALSRSGCSMADIDCFIPHQANIRMIEVVARQLGAPLDKVLVNIDRYGNMSSASIPAALDEGLQNGRLHPGSVVLMAAAGAGLTWSAIVVRL